MNTNLSRGIQRFNRPIIFHALITPFLLVGYVHAAPAGGNITGGTGEITQSGAQTQIVQDTARLSIDWDSFNVGRTERVQFIQPSSEAMALNRILDNNPSEIMGRIDANGRIVLTNPNGLIFGSGSTINVQSLIASGLDIESGDFMNADLHFEGVSDSTGFIVSRGLINAATGGNVALLAKRVEHTGLISANLGHIALVSGNQAVVTFDDEGLIGVSVPEATLANEVGSDYALINDGTLRAASGKILLTAAASEDLFSAAVNSGHLSGAVAVTAHEDGSFTIGAGHAIRNDGRVEVSAAAGSGLDAGHAILAGESIVLQGRVEANAAGDNAAGNIQLKSQDRIFLGQNSHLRAESPTTDSGLIRVEAGDIAGTIGAVVKTDGNTVLVGHDRILTPRVVSNHGLIASSGVVRQRGYVRLDENLHVWGDGADIGLAHTGNRYGSLSISAVNGATINIARSAPFAMSDIVMNNSDLTLDARGWDSALAQTNEGALVLEGGSMTLHADSIELGNVQLQDAMFTANAGEQFSQAQGATIAAEGGVVVVNADNIVLGGNESRTEIRGGDLNLQFREAIQTNRSIALVEVDAVESSAAFYGRPESDDHNIITLTGRGEVDLAAQVSNEWGDLMVNVEHMMGDNARFFRIYDVYVNQTGPITLADTLTMDVRHADLNHPENDFGSIEGAGANGGPSHFGGFSIYDRNDVTLKNIVTHPDGRDSVYIQAAGTITQAPDTIIKVPAIELIADKIDLGADGTSEVTPQGNAFITFSNQLRINGRFSPGRGAYIYGDEGENTVIFGEYADSDPFYANTGPLMLVQLYGGDDRLFVFGGNLVSIPYIYEPDQDGESQSEPEYVWENPILMGEGNDQVHLHADIQVPLELNEGNDVVTVNKPGIIYQLSDFNPDTDILVETYP